jgi:hypothetical protein
MKNTSKVFIIEILKKELNEKRNSLKTFANDKDCPITIYEKALDKCSNIEYAIEQMEKLS